MILITLLAITIIAGFAILTHHNHQKPYMVNICQKCLETRFDNAWVGFNAHQGFCNYCHKYEIVDKRPMGQLQKKNL
jgi:hypothetical protein